MCRILFMSLVNYSLFFHCGTIPNNLLPARHSTKRNTNILLNSKPKSVIVRILFYLFLLYNRIRDEYLLLTVEICRDCLLALGSILYYWPGKAGLQHRWMQTQGHAILESIILESLIEGSSTNIYNVKWKCD